MPILYNRYTIIVSGKISTAIDEMQHYIDKSNNKLLAKQKIHIQAASDKNNSTPMFNLNSAHQTNSKLIDRRSAVNAHNLNSTMIDCYSRIIDGEMVKPVAI